MADIVKELKCFDELDVLESLETKHTKTHRRLYTPHNAKEDALNCEYVMDTRLPLVPDTYSYYSYDTMGRVPDEPAHPYDDYPAVRYPEKRTSKCVRNTIWNHYIALKWHHETRDVYSERCLQSLEKTTKYKFIMDAIESNNIEPREVMRALGLSGDEKLVCAVSMDKLPEHQVRLGLPKTWEKYMQWIRKQDN